MKKIEELMLRDEIEKIIALKLSQLIVGDNPDRSGYTKARIIAEAIEEKLVLDEGKIYEKIINWAMSQPPKKCRSLATALSTAKDIIKMKEKK